MVDIEGRLDCEILNSGADVKTSASWFPDGKRVLAMVETETHQRVGVLELASGELRWLLDDPARNIERAFVPYGSEQIVVVEIQRARACCSLLDPTTGTKTRLPEIPSNLIPIAPLANKLWVGQYYSSRQPADAVRFAPADPDPERFTSLSRIWERTSLTAADLAPAEDVSWVSVDGLEIQGWLYRPAQEPRGTVVPSMVGRRTTAKTRSTTKSSSLCTRALPCWIPTIAAAPASAWPFAKRSRDGWGGLEQEDIRAGIEAMITRELPIRAGWASRAPRTGVLCLVRHFPLPVRDRGGSGAHLRHDRSGRGL